MSEAEAAEEQVDRKPGPDIHSFLDVLRSLTNKIVTMVNPESLENAPMGFQLTTGFYRAKVLGVQGDFLTVATELLHKGRDASKEPIKQFIPITSIKRVSVGKADVFIHI